MIQIAIKEALSKHGDKTDIRHVRDEIFSIGKQEGKEEFLKLAEFNLAPWCDGQYAKFFIGKNEVNFKNRLIVLELGAVKDNRELMSLLLMTLFFHINKEIYLGDRSIKKLVIWDEAWRFFQDEEMLRFIEQGAREYRKFNGSIITITQNISDFQMNKVTKVLKSTSDFMFILEQKPEEWEKIHRDKELDISDFEKDVLKSTLKTLKGYWSEIYMVTPRGRGIGRLILSPFFYWLYTTDAHDVAIRQKFMAESSSIEEAIQKCIEHTAKR
jgi:conjugal transfer ATP-binding protein TraC